MSLAKRTATVVTLAVMMAACSQSPPAPEPEPVAEEPAEPMPGPPAAESPEPATTAPGPAGPASSAPNGNVVAYACDDGSGLTVTYDEYSAMVKLPTGATTLSRAESPSAGGAEAYLGEELSLYRDGHLVQLHGAGKPRTCTAAQASG